MSRRSTRSDGFLVVAGLRLRAREVGERDLVLPDAEHPPLDVHGGRLRADADDDVADREDEGEGRDDREDPHERGVAEPAGGEVGRAVEQGVAAEERQARGDARREQQPLAGGRRRDPHPPVVRHPRP
ncbi:hypothetical protein [Clavibacter tessellarius]|uniref:hypothetical protein n=1 Tax=Clavibacter tessellarius TaxID=31965 RepID=UPI0032478DD8